MDLYNVVEAQVLYGARVPRLKTEVCFPESAPAAYPVFFRTYSRKYNNKRESWAEVSDRTLAG
nr:hypothetical protein [Pseudanabaena mucicola]